MPGSGSSRSITATGSPRGRSTAERSSAATGSGPDSRTLLSCRTAGSPQATASWWRPRRPCWRRPRRYPRSMAPRTEIFDVGRLMLSSGEGRRLELDVPVDGFEFGGQRYAVAGEDVHAILDVAHTTNGYSLRLRFAAEL